MASKGKGRTSVRTGEGADEARPSMSLTRAYSKVARFEYLPAEVLLILIPVLLVVRSPWDVVSVKFAEAVVVFFLLYFTGFMANALSDRDVDARYSSYKSSVAKAVDRIGETRLKLLLGVHIFIALLISSHLFLTTGDYLVPMFVALGVFLGVGYSLKPFNFKTRGVAHGFALALSAFFLPLAFLMVILAGTLDFNLILFITGFSMAMYSLEFGNQALDHFEDKEVDLRTPSVRYSMRDSLRFALILLPVGLLLTSISMVDLSLSKFKDIHPLAADWAIIMIVTGLLCAGFVRPAAGLFRIFRSVPQDQEEGPRAKRVVLKALKQVDHPSWQASGAFGVFVVCCIIFGSMFFSFTVPRQESPDINKVPEVHILNNPDMIVNAGDIVEFKAEIKDDGDIMSYQWEFGDGTGSSGRNSTHIYRIPDGERAPQAHMVRFTAIDDGGLKGYHFINITVTKLQFSNLEFKAKRYLTYTHVDFEFNVTNDKDLKRENELIVKVYYSGLCMQTLGLRHELDPAKIWNRGNGMDIAKLEEEPTFRIVLFQDIGGEMVVIEDRTVVTETTGPGG